MEQEQDIFSSKSYREFLQTVLQDRERRGRRLRLRELAEMAGFRSPAAISMVLRGQRRLPITAAEGLAQGLCLDKRRKDYFLALTRYEHARNVEERANARERLIELQARQEENPLDLRAYHFLAVWYYPTLYVLTETKDFKEDALWIAKRLGRGITPSQVRKAIEDLLALGLLSRKENKLVQTRRLLTTKDDVRSVAIHRYHQKMLQLANAALELPFDEREINGLTLALSRSQLPSLKEKIRQFRKDIHESLSDSSQSDEVFQINIQLFPLTLACPQDEGSST